MSTNYKNIKKLALGIICFEGTEHLANIISELRLSVDYVTIGLLRLSYHGDPIPQVDLNEIFRLKDEDHLVDLIVEIDLDTTKPAREQETDKRNLIILDAEDHGCTHIIVIDSDEYYTRKSFEYACSQIDEHNYEITYCLYVNYYHDYKHFLVYPFKLGMYVPFVTRTKYRHSFECTDFTLPSDPTRRYVRPFNGYKQVTDSNGKVHKVKNYTVEYHVFNWNEVKMHHLSWLRADIRKKLNMWSSKKCFENFNDLIDRAVYSWKHFDINSTEAKALMLFNTPGNSVDVKAFPKQYIHPKYDFNTRLRKCKDYKRLLVLSMSATGSEDTKIFDELEKVSNETWRNYDKEKYPNINVEFWTYTDTDKDTYVDKDKHIIYIKKDPNHEGLYLTYSKTIYAFKELDKLGLQYDYMIRTNNSTWLNIPLLNEFLSWQDDDSLIFGGRVYGAFWSAFNLYASGELMIFHKRTVDIIIKNAGEKPEEFEQQVQGCDDNLIGGVINRRLLELGLRESDFIMSIGDMQCIEKELPEDIDFSYSGIQIKTYGVNSQDRILYDSKKMREIDAKWRNINLNVEDLYNELMLKHYNNNINLITYTKSEWNKLSENEKRIAKLKTVTNREKALHYLRIKQPQCGYKKTNI